MPDRGSRRSYPLKIILQYFKTKISTRPSRAEILITSALKIHLNRDCFEKPLQLLLITVVTRLKVIKSVS